MNSAKRKFAAFDIDGTVFRWQLYHELFDSLAASGHIDRADWQAVNQARESWSRREYSFGDYEELLVGVMERKVIGLPEAVVRDAARTILSAKGHRTYAYTRQLMKELQEEGYFIIAISGSYQQLVEAFAALHHIDLAIGTDYEITDGVFARKRRAVFGHKGTILETTVAEYNLTWDESYAVGDSSSDGDILALVTHPIAFNPDDKLFALASQHKWPVVIERKNMIYRLENHDGTYLLAQANPR